MSTHTHKQLSAVWHPRQLKIEINLKPVHASASTGVQTGKKNTRGPTRNLFPSCQDDSARAVGTCPDHYDRGRSNARGEKKRKKKEENRWNTAGEASTGVQGPRERPRVRHRSVVLFLSFRSSL